MRNFLKEFQAFISKGNVMDLAVAVIIGAAFSNIVNSLVKDIVNPILGVLVGRPDFTNLFVVLKPVEGYTGPQTYEALVKAGATVFGYGAFLTAVVQFLLLAFVIFWLIKVVTTIRKRLEAVRKLNMLANLMQRRISSDQENLTVSYEIHGGEDMTKPFASWYNEMLRKSQETDILRGSKSYGPHHDDIVLTVNGINLRTFGSQGQQRTGVLSLKLAELEFLRSETGEYPILLLDDVMSELDVKRRQQLLQFIRRERIQTLITATDAAYFPAEGMGQYYHVRSGQIST